MFKFIWKARYLTAVILFVVSIVMYMDRMIISTAIPYIAKDLKLSPLEMGTAMSAFFIGYTALQIPGGILVDKIGARKVSLWGISWWTLFTAFTGLAGSFTSLITIRALFGAGEGVFPGSMFRMIANWFPKKERGTVTAIMTSTTSWGPAIAPIFTTLVMLAWGWQAAFYIMVIPGILMVLWIWYCLPDDPSKKRGITLEELADIQEEESAKVIMESKFSFWDVIKLPAVWQCLAILFLFDIGLWGFRTWLPTYLVQARGFSMSKMGIVASLPFFAGGVGYIVGGWISDNLFSKKRKIPIILCQWIAAVFLYFTYFTSSKTSLVVLLIFSGFFLSVSAGAFWALPISTLSKSITGRAMSIINTGGQIAGTLAPIIIGFLVQTSGGGFGTTFALMIAGVVGASLFALLVRTPKQNYEATNDNTLDL